jgi:potassium-transporting ATPase potassium-binding subunit
MSGTWVFQSILFLAILTTLAMFLGEYMARVFEGKRTLLSPIIGPIEKVSYKIFGIDQDAEMDWKTYVKYLILFCVTGAIILFLLQEFQHILPLNPQHCPAVRWDIALNSAISFVTNTNWQAYKNETTISYLTQMLGFGLQNFLSAGVGIAVGVAFLRAFIRKDSKTIGNFWVDLTRSILYILLPLAVILSLLLVSQGTVQNLNSYVKAHTIQGTEQVIAQGPAASQIAIKHLGTNGGGFFQANSAHPYENPTPLTDYLTILSQILIAAAFPFILGAMLNNRRQGWALFGVMLVLFLLGLYLAVWAEFHGNPILSKLGVHHGISMEGKEVRIGNFSSVFFGQTATATSTGSTNAMHSSLMPLTSLVFIFNMAIGEVIFGGVGIGIVSLLMYGLLTMFLIGLMIGRSPEIFGKKLEAYEMILAIFAVMGTAIVQLVFDAIAMSSKAGVAAISNIGPRGLSEVIYAFASAMGNNGSAMLGLDVSKPFYTLTIAIAMIIGRFLYIICGLAIAGSLAQKKLIPINSRFPTASPVFVFVMVVIIFILGALTFFPMLILGPFVEHLTILAQHVF